MHLHKMEPQIFRAAFLAAILSFIIDKIQPKKWEQQKWLLTDYWTITAPLPAIGRTSRQHLARTRNNWTTPSTDWLTYIEPSTRQNDKNGTFNMMDCILCNKSNLNTFKQIKIIHKYIFQLQWNEIRSQWQKDSLQRTGNWTT